MSRSTFTLTDIDRGWDRIKRAAEELEDTELSVGLWGNAYPTGTPVAQVGFWLEHGTSKMRPRKWMSTPFDNNIGRYIDARDDAWEKIIHGAGKSEQVVDDMGELMARHLRSHVVLIDMIDTARLLGTIDHTQDQL